MNLCLAVGRISEVVDPLYFSNIPILFFTPFCNFRQLSSLRCVLSDSSASQGNIYIFSWFYIPSISRIKAVMLYTSSLGSIIVVGIILKTLFASSSILSDGTSLVLKISITRNRYHIFPHILYTIGDLIWSFNIELAISLWNLLNSVDGTKKEA